MSGGTAKEVSPKNGKDFSLDELYELVGSPIDIQTKDGDDRCLVLRDDGKLLDLPVNEKASQIWKEWYPINEHPLNNDETIVGDVLVCSRTQLA